MHHVTLSVLLMLLTVLLGAILFIVSLSTHYLTANSTQILAVSEHGNASEIDVEYCAIMYSANVSKLFNYKFSYIILDPDEVNRSDIIEIREHIPNVKILAYVNIGLAESWRSYWEKVLSLGIVHGESEYSGEYYVEYWSSKWMNIIHNIVLNACKKGFDGVMLDNLDVCMVLKYSNFSWVPRDPCALMISVVKDVYNFSKRVCGRRFLIFVNIGSAINLLKNSSLLSSIDGVVREESIYMWNGDKCVPVDNSTSRYILTQLSTVRRLGKTVILVECVENMSMVYRVARIAAKYGFCIVPQPAWDPNYEGPPLVPAGK